ncbi:MAG: oligosaccharide flippase family protein [Pseudomonadota bacterium]
MAADVSKRTAFASAALLGARLFVKIVDLALILILAWILVPEDFALVAIAMIFIQFTESVTEIPVIQALIRTPKVTDSMLDTAFTISAIRALLVAGLVTAMAPAAMYIYDEPRLGLLMVFLALSPALRGLVNPKLVMYARRLNYFPEAIIDTLAKIVTACVAIPLALWTQSYWSLAIMTVLTPISMIIGSYIFAPYRPRLSLKEWPVFSDMISWTTVSQFFVAANWQADIFVLGLNAKKDMVGQYSISQTLAGAPFQVLVIPIIRPFIAAFAELRTPEAIRPGYLTASSAVVTAVAPILALVACLAEPIVTLAFNDSWSGASLFLAVLSLSAIISLPSQPVPSVVLALDKARFNALQAAIGLIIKVPCLFIGWHMAGVNGFLVGVLIGATAWTIAGSFIVRHLIGLRLRDQALSMSRPFAGMAGLAVTVYFMRPFLSYDTPLMIVITSAMLGAAGMLAYTIIVAALWKLSGEPEGMESMIAGLVRKVTRRGAEAPETSTPPTETQDV